MTGLKSREESHDPLARNSRSTEHVKGNAIAPISRNQKMRCPHCSHFIWSVLAGLPACANGFCGFNVRSPKQRRRKASGPGEKHKSSARRISVFRRQSNLSWPGFENHWERRHLAGLLLKTKCRLEAGAPSGAPRIIPLGTQAAIPISGNHARPFFRSNTTQDPNHDHPRRVVQLRQASHRL